MDIEMNRKYAEQTANRISNSNLPLLKRQSFIQILYWWSDTCGSNVHKNTQLYMLCLWKRTFAQYTVRQLSSLANTVFILICILWNTLNTVEIFSTIFIHHKTWKLKTCITEMYLKPIFIRNCSHVQNKTKNLNIYEKCSTDVGSVMF
jgi:hypothetical protein